MMTSHVRIDLQNDDDQPGVPNIQHLERWVSASLQQDYSNLEQTIRVVDELESQALNHTYRGKNHPTNVLSFTADDADYLDYDHLGDLVICAPVVEREAREQGKSLQAHWAHMVVHGMLHLQGYDHLTDADASEMEALEIEILQSLGHTNPYQDFEST